MLAVTNLAKSVPGQGGVARTLFAGLSLALAPGDYVAVMGESGVGKSTLLNLIAGLDAPDTGSIVLDGRELVDLNDDARTLLRRQTIGFVFQAFHVLPYLTLAWNVALPLLLLGTAEGEALARAQAMLADVGMGDRTESMPRELSGGELQRVAIARALVHRPRLVLADEPTGNLDPDTAQQIATLLRARMAESGAAGILVTHSLAAAASTQRVLQLTRDGLQPA